MDGKFIRVLRKSLGVSQDEFARYLGATRRTIANWEAGRYQPSHAYRRAIAEFMEQSANTERRSDA